MKQKLLLMTFFYDPAAGNPGAIADGAIPITAEALSTGIEKCIERGGVVHISHIEADLVPLACNQNGSPLAHEWVGVTFVPVQPAATEAIFMEEAVDAR